MDLYYNLSSVKGATLHPDFHRTLLKPFLFYGILNV